MGSPFCSEADGTLDVCAVITGVPADGLEMNISVSFNLDLAGEFLMTLEFISFIFLTTGGDFEFKSPFMVIFSHDTFEGDTLCTEIGIVDDDVYEGKEQFLVSIASVSPPSAAIIGTTSSLPKVIEDNRGCFFSNNNNS